MYTYRTDHDAALSTDVTSVFAIVLADAVKGLERLYEQMDELQSLLRKARSQAPESHGGDGLQPVQNAPASTRREAGHADE